MYLRDGFIVQRDGDSGDTAHRHGWLRTAQQLRYYLRLGDCPVEGVVLYQAFLAACGFPDYPQRSPWGNGNAGKFSRDQAIPNLTAISVLGYEWEHDRFVNNMKRSWSKYGIPRLPNGDIATPQIFNLCRAQASRLGLMELFFNTLVCSIKVRLNNDDTDQTLNTFCMFAFEYSRNRASWLVRGMRLVFKYLHPSVTAAMRSYFRADMGGNPELAEVWVPIVEYILK